MSRARDLGAFMRICVDGARTVAVAADELDRRRAELQAIYEGTHEGALPPRELRVMGAPSPFRADLVELGALVAVTYRTVKGTGRHERYHDWEHEFGPKKLPVLAFNAEGLVILGGKYRVTPRGIVG